MPEPRAVTSVEALGWAEGQGEERRVLVLHLNSRRRRPRDATLAVRLAALTTVALCQLNQILRNVTAQADLFMRSVGAKR